MKSYLKMYGWALYMGVATSIVGFNFMNWEFHFLAIPLSMLVCLRDDEVIRRAKEQE